MSFLLQESCCSLWTNFRAPAGLSDSHWNQRVFNFRQGRSIILWIVTPALSSQIHYEIVKSSLKYLSPCLFSFLGPHNMLYSYASTELVIGFCTKRSKTHAWKDGGHWEESICWYPFVSKLGKVSHFQISMFSDLQKSRGHHLDSSRYLVSLIRKKL